MKLNSTKCLLALCFIACYQQRTKAAVDSNPIGKIEVVNQILPGDPFQPSGKSSEIKGVLSYSYMKRFEPRQTVIVVRSFGGKQKITSYVVNSSGESDVGIYDVRRSFDGKYIGFKLGYSAGFESSYKLFVLDVTKETIVQVSEKRLSYQDYSWSPDSHFLAYIEGGNLLGEVDVQDKTPLRLIIWDATKGQQKLVVTNDFVAHSFTWATPHTLYYSAPQVTNGKVQGRPNLYRFSLETSESTLVLKDCYRPVISPDGKQVAFFGSEDLDKPFPLAADWRQKANYMALCVATLDGKNRTALNVEHSEYPIVIWEDQEKSVLTLKQVSESPIAELSIVRWDLASQRKREVARLIARDYQPQQRSELFPQFIFLGKSAQENKLLFAVSEVLGEDPENVTLKIRRVIQVINLSTRSEQQLGYSSKAIFFNWTATEQP